MVMVLLLQTTGEDETVQLSRASIRVDQTPSQNLKSMIHTVSQSADQTGTTLSTSPISKRLH
jgi:hypothetical protein